jgi:CDP-glycerol glycerophosphotransferase
LTTIKVAIVYVMCLLVPKRADQYYLEFQPDSDASIYPILHALSGTNSTVIRAMAKPVALDWHERVPAFGVEVVTCRSGSLRGFLHFLRSRYVLASHPILGIKLPSPRQTVAYLSHGMPAKKFGLTDGGSTRIFADLCLSSAEAFRPALAAGLGVPVDRVFLDHSPRVEAMCTWPNPAVWSQLGIDRRRFDYVIVWAPTFRGRSVSITEHSVSTGVLASPDLLGALSRLLVDRRCLLVIKRHPYESPPAKTNVANVHELCQNQLNELNLSFYDVLAEADALITDVSSVWIDFLILDRPIIIYAPDLDDYRRERGLVLEPYEDWTPSPVLIEEDELMAAIQCLLVARDDHADRRRATTARLIPAHSPIGTSQRLMERLSTTNR